MNEFRTKTADGYWNESQLINDYWNESQSVNIA